MMLNQRQIEILLELCENAGSYRTAAFFVDKQQISLRTVQNDMRAIRKHLENTTCVEYQSVTTKGSRIVVTDQERFAALKEGLYQQLGNATMSYQSERVNQLLLLLLDQKRPSSLFNVESTIFVSRNTLLGDLKLAAKVLRKYDLELLRGENRVMVDGSELNKRLCIYEENLIFANAQDGFTGQKHTMDLIKDILVETFVTFQQNISEVELNNLILQLCVALHRMEQSFFLSPEEFEITQDLNPEREMASAIIQQFRDKFHLRIPETETDFIALYMKGRGNPAAAAVITQEMDDLVLNGLREIRSAFGIDLTNDVNLRIALALHCTQLLVRVQTNTQMQSHILDYIRQTFPQGFDIATYFASFLQKRFQKKVRDEEIAFIAIHLYKSLSDLQSGAGTKKILVISSLRRSENILIRQTLYKWFSDQIAELFFLPPSLMDQSYLDRYDTFLTTEKGKYYEMGLAFYISPFPNQHDYLNLKLALDGFKSIDDILQIFHRDLFEIFKKDMDRQEILHMLCGKATQYYGLEGLSEAVMEREALGSTFFGNGIAAPHPMFAVSSDTFIAVGVSPRPVEWDQKGNRVRLVMLVSVGKNNAKAFQLWNYLSKIFADKTFTDSLAENPDYEHFLKLLKAVIAEDFKT